MLTDNRAIATLPAEDLQRAKSFYADVLGLKPADENPGGLIYEVGEGNRFLVFPSPTRPSGHTQMSFWVKDVGAEVKDLKDKGVVFEEYDFPQLKTEGGIATLPSGRAAWFKDSEGNMIGVFQLAT
jgi:predicted enzyme related to lactoylglutathione lyase